MIQPQEQSVLFNQLSPGEATKQEQQSLAKTSQGSLLRERSEPSLSLLQIQSSFIIHFEPKVWVTCKRESPLFISTPPGLANRTAHVSLLLHHWLVLVRSCRSFSLCQSSPSLPVVISCMFPTRFSVKITSISPKKTLIRPYIINLIEVYRRTCELSTIKRFGGHVF